MKIDKKEYLYASISAFIYGISPFITSYTYNHGNNGLNMAFYRNFFCIPFLLILCLFKKKLKVSITQLKNLIIASFLGPTATSALLYTSYNYLPSGISTVIHFIYPVFVILFSICAFGIKITSKHKLSLILSTLGLLLFFDIKAFNNFFGAILAISSGITYAMYLVWIKKSKLNEIDSLVLSFYISFISSFIFLLFNIKGRFIVINLDINIWMIILFVSLLTSFFATYLLQNALKVLEPYIISIISLIEPVVSFSLEIILQNELLNLNKFIGFILIICSVTLTITKNSNKKIWKY